MKRRDSTGYGRRSRQRPQWFVRVDWAASAGADAELTTWLAERDGTNARMERVELAGRARQAARRRP